MLSEKVGIALVGSGYSAVNNHLPQLVKVPNAKLVAIVGGRSKSKAKEVAEHFGAEAYYSYAELQEALKREDVQMVDVNVPTWLHKDVTVAATEAGKHILCEKPMASSLKEADEMIEAAEKAGVKLMIAHCLRFWPDYIKVKKIIDQGTIGKPLAARALRIPGPGYPWEWMWFQGGLPPEERSRYSPSNPPEAWQLAREKSLGIIDLQIHDIDIVRYMLGSEVESVSAVGGNYVYKSTNCEDHCYSVLRFRDAKVAQITATWIRPIEFPFEQSLEIHGTEGYLTLRSKDQPSITVYGNDGSISKVAPAQANGYYEQIAHFVQCILKDEKPMIPPADSRGSLETGLAILKSMELRKPVSLPLE